MKRSVRFDRAAGFYDATRGYPPGVDGRVADALVAVGGLGPASRVLEIGIGTGRIARPLARRVRAVYGVDLSRPMLERLRAQREDLPLWVAQAEAARLPFAGASFDAAVGVHVFHLMAGWREALAELARVLRPGAPLLNAGDAGGVVRAFAQAGAGPDGEALQRLWQELLGERLTRAMADVGVPRQQVETFLGDEGWRPLAETRVVEFTHLLAPRAILAQLEQRSWSSTWRLDDAQLAELVATARRLLLERFGSLDEEVEVGRQFRVRPWAPPA